MKTLFCALLMAFPVAAQAGETVPGEAPGSITWKAGVDGVEIYWAPDGSVEKISSKQSVPVEFADRRGIKKAQTIAEEKAKAGIIRFLEQDVTSTRVVTEIQNDISTAEQLRETGANAQVTKRDERMMMENLTEITTSYSSGELAGVIVLETGYDEAMEEAWTVVGISRKTQAARAGVETLLTEPETQAQGDGGGQGGIVEHGSETRSNTSDW